MKKIAKAKIFYTKKVRILDIKMSLECKDFLKKHFK